AWQSGICLLAIHGCPNMEMSLPETPGLPQGTNFGSTIISLRIIKPGASPWVIRMFWNPLRISGMANKEERIFTAAEGSAIYSWRIFRALLMCLRQKRRDGPQKVEDGKGVVEVT